MHNAGLVEKKESDSPKVFVFLVPMMILFRLSQISQCHILRRAWLALMRGLGPSEKGRVMILHFKKKRIACHSIPIR